MSSNGSEVARGEKCWGISTIGRSAANDAGFATRTGRSGRWPLTVGWAPGTVTHRVTPSIQPRDQPSGAASQLDRSATAIRLAGRGGAPALLGDVFAPSPASGRCPQPGTGRWRTVLLVDGNVGLGGDPRRILARAAELLARGGRCVVEFDTEVIGVRPRRVRLESAREVGPWFRWASVGVDSAGTLAAQVGLTLAGVRLIGGRMLAIMVAL